MRAERLNYVPAGQQKFNWGHQAVPVQRRKGP
jgi:hypothetical protein